MKILSTALGRVGLLLGFVAIILGLSPAIRRKMPRLSLIGGGVLVAGLFMTVVGFTGVASWVNNQLNRGSVGLAVPAMQRVIEGDLRDTALEMEIAATDRFPSVKTWIWLADVPEELHAGDGSRYYEDAERQWYFSLLRATQPREEYVKPGTLQLQEGTPGESGITIFRVKGGPFDGATLAERIHPQAGRSINVYSSDYPRPGPGSPRGRPSL